MPVEQTGTNGGELEVTYANRLKTKAKECKMGLVSQLSETAKANPFSLPVRTGNCLHVEKEEGTICFGPVLTNIPSDLLVLYIIA
ncbi:hypothetical protein COOONC_20746 [Cooperia oncophora]